MKSSKRKLTQELFDGTTLRGALQAALRRVERHVDELNRLNVFPVPDGDTGINMVLTLKAANRAIDGVESSSAAVVASTAARGALLGASGNSGVILSQILRGIARGLEMKEHFTTSHFAMALQAARENAYRAVTNPAEGTILTVVSDIAQTAQTMVERGANLKQMMGAVVIQARRTVRRTPELLPQLREAGVEDAGAKGFLYVLQGIREAVANRVSKVTDMNPAVIPQPITDTSGTGGRIWGYDLQFLIYGKGMPLDAIRARIEMMGESVLVVGDEELLRVHLHTHEPEAVLEYARTAGNVDNISCQDMDSQVAEHQKKVSAKRI